MATALLYGLTALVIGWTIWQRILWGGWGAPVHFIHWLALGCAGLLALSALLAGFDRKNGSAVVLAVLIVLWFFYLPDLFSLLEMMGSATWKSLTLRLGIFALLGASTACAICCIKAQK
ncbi:MAG: hypothetical protein HYT88_06325 [Candidatus Omnitrophica bacterium]|nr:hypothetical protein [Candidatus Omnitrophota bacterium]MBI3010120.1 hypothetical protein [Candidatus Omnitrophota bacterium]